MDPSADVGSHLPAVGEAVEQSIAGINVIFNLLGAYSNCSATTRCGEPRRN